ncbi:MAG: XRE family transcriptional regulator [Marinisporobacter sp.]|jgi:transcriptional regulator with XRE-family HTH domain|nr:XRE family transcriptional regulator [Marinisporobacter sp.]
MSKDVGKKIKELRSVKKLTLKDLSERTNLSTGFLSQLERGLTTIAVDSLENISKALEVDLSYFFVLPQNNNSDVIRSYEQTVSQIKADKFIYFHLSNDLENKRMLPRMVTILPSSEDENIEEFQHEGEEFIYVLEGILTLYVNHQRYDLYHGDSMHLDSNLVHNWCNHTNKITKILVVSAPNPFRKDK